MRIAGTQGNLVRRRMVYAGFLLLATVLTPPPTQAACKKPGLDNIDRVIYNAGGGYDVYATNAVPAAATVTVQNSTGACSYFLTVDGGRSGGPGRQMRDGANVLRYELYTSANQGNILRDVPGATAAEVLSGSFGPGNQSGQHQFYLVVPAQQVVPPGIYRDTVTVTLYEGTLSGYTEVRSRNVLIEAAVAERIDLSLVDPGMAIDPSRSSRVIDFGTLIEGETSWFDLLVRSNAGYTVTIASENRGAMKILNPADPSTVPYALRVNGSAINLNSIQPATLSAAVAQTPSAGVAHSMQLIIGPIGDASAGDYQDILTLTVIANP